MLQPTPLALHSSLCIPTSSEVVPDVLAYAGRAPFQYLQTHLQR